LPHEIEFTAEAVVTRNPASWPAGVIVDLQQSIVHQRPSLEINWLLSTFPFPRVSKTWGDPFKEPLDSGGGKNSLHQKERWGSGGQHVLHVFVK
jgi:hypothetical protein